MPRTRQRQEDYGGDPRGSLRRPQGPSYDPEHDEFSDDQDVIIARPWTGDTQKREQEYERRTGGASGSYSELASRPRTPPRDAPIKRKGAGRDRDRSRSPKGRGKSKGDRDRSRSPKGKGKGKSKGGPAPPKSTPPASAYRNGGRDAPLERLARPVAAVVRPGGDAWATKGVAGMIFAPLEMPTKGSAGHADGTCKPCAFYASGKGCQNGVNCEYCHLCGPDELKRRKKEGKKQFRHGGGLSASALPGDAAQEAWLDELPGDEFKPEECDVRDALLVFLGQWRNGAALSNESECATMQHAKKDNEIAKTSRSLLPRGCPVTLSAWIQRRIGAEVTVEEGSRDVNTIVYLTDNPPAKRRRQS